MLYDVKGDLVNDEKFNIFCHQTNCKGVMGAGIAKQIAIKYPSVYHRNQDYCRIRFALGTILPVRVSPSRICVNIYGQNEYGIKGCYTDYNAVQSALNELASRLNASNIPHDWIVGFPHNMGCGLAGGQWNRIHTLITNFSYKVKNDVYIVHGR